MTTKNRQTCPATGCQTCRHCIPDPHNGTTATLEESGKVCDIMAPMFYGIIIRADLTGWGGLNCQHGKPCRDYEPAQEA